MLKERVSEMLVQIRARRIPGVRVGLVGAFLGRSWSGFRAPPGVSFATPGSGL